MAFTRREFIRIGALGAGAVAAVSGLTTNWWSLQGHGVPDPKTDGDHVVPTFCELCFWKCGVLAHVKDGRVTKIVGNPAHPLSRGRICPRGTGGVGLLYDPDRLKTPLIRRAKRGQQVFEAVSWAAALDETARQLDGIRTRYGPEALALFTHGWGGSWFTRLTQAYGSPNIAAPSYAQCRGPRDVAFTLTYGQGVGSPEALDIDNARCITLIGSHLGENMHNTQVQEFADAIGQGAQVVVVDPRFSVAASKARYWLPIKPGTDIARLLAWMNVIIKERRYDAEYITKYATGFDDLAKHVESKTPEWAEPITGIGHDTIRETGRFISGFRPASLIHPGRHVTWYGDDTQRVRAVAILTALLGNWGRRGGYVLPSSIDVPKYPGKKGEKPKREVADRRVPSLYPLADETLASGVCDATIPGRAPYPLKAWLVYGTNLIQSLPDPRNTEKAIKQLDFIATIDVLPAEIAGWSDVVLPESTYLERFDDVWSPAYKQPFIAVRQPAVAPMHDSKPGWWIARELANRLGLGDSFAWKDPVEHAEWRVKASGHDFRELLSKGVILGATVPVAEEEGLALSFDTPSKKIELVSSQLAAAGFDSLPNYTPHDEPPPGMFRLLFGRAPMHTFGRTTNNRFLGSVYDENEVWINSLAAKSLTGFEERPLRSGDRIVLENQDGIRSAPVKAKVTERIRGDAVFMVHGFGHTAKGLTFAKGRGASDSGLVTRYETDPVMGGTGMNVNFVRILRAEA
ncbi:MAG TPA: molybdopterin-dependent oxidoreductase [Thermoanaerobaculia bacterium]|nr:molybdopterin-dependent oxidoreductase [Thermoanaerobaculia bacterium]